MSQSIHIVTQYCLQASITYNDFCSADQIMAKGALYAEVEVAGGIKMHVFNTHLQSFYSLDHVEAHRVELLACLCL